MALASHLSMSLQRCKSETSSREFVQWCAWLKRKANERTTDHWYMAQIAAELRQARSKKRIKLKDLLLTFETKTEEESGPLTEAQKQRRLETSKMFWGAVVANPQANKKD